jgi:hypothetical protein
MKTDTLDIRYSHVSSKYDVRYERSDIERIDHKPQPSKMGFYHFHRKIGPKKAFIELKQYLIDSANEEILKLQAYVNEINALELPDWIANYKKL